MGRSKGLEEAGNSTTTSPVHANGEHMGLRTGDRQNKPMSSSFYSHPYVARLQVSSACTYAHYAGSCLCKLPAATTWLDMRGLPIRNATYTLTEANMVLARFRLSDASYKQTCRQAFLTAHQSRFYRSTIQLRSIPRAR